MKLLQAKLFQHLCAMLFFLTLATAGCQKDGGNAEGQKHESPGPIAKDESGPEHAIVLHDNNGADYNPAVDPANFVSTIDNPYFNLTPGKVWIYEGKNDEGETERIEVAVTPDTKTILGVAATVVREREWVEGELVEDTFDWYAQDNEGNVWYFGEDSKEIAEGVVVSTAGSWEAGVNGAKPGMIMKANARGGEAYRQEYLKGEAEDMGQVLGVEESITIGLGSYGNCLRIKDWTPLEPETVEHKFYSAEVGNMILEKKVAGESGQMELIEFKAE